ncbi:MAG: zinc-dependent alcohol dehydrogenase family protein [Algoriphagus sp.]|uniref:zinc-dependent alcohol dehydrogenase family protein n=1 Tax=Algoriphagus sp. TaxID=1872435 RepID=UPI00273172E5|nr:zinc-dependent alcohol dehydrogenase family protein [Algoriphagus sp.]MDP2043344.1 zinc-dependent alcohol dehydrogenase family protein [Algoriphagus sp.]MDP3471178.1 zinc-dependent alcohol dehydrogenase family protein [Algoriphagus sp.]
MHALIIDSFQHTPSIHTVPDPTSPQDGVVIEVKATGLCRSDWHGWMGHDSDIRLPHVPGHEFAGVIREVGKGVSNWKIGDRVTVPFVCACGTCQTCQSGNQQICDDQFQPGFTHWGSFAEYVAVHRAETNLVRLPDSVSFEAAASLGCRFATSFRGIVAQGKVSGGQWVAVHGCGGVGLSAIMIAAALGATVIAVDISEEKLALAKAAGASFLINGKTSEDIPSTIIELTKGGAHVSVDALGSKITCYNSIASLRKRGKHIQIGLMAGNESNPPIPMHLVIAKELEILGSHGMQAHAYPEMMQLILEGKIAPEKLIGRRISLKQAVESLIAMDTFQENGMVMIDRF